MDWFRSATDATADVARAYLAGASRDGHVNRLHRTLRISQANVDWLRLLQVLFDKAGSRSWIYRESARRSVWTIETCYVIDPSPVLVTRGEVAAFVRGYFDAEGGVPRGREAGFYIQLCQKNYTDLFRLREMLVGRLGIACGRIHNPSALADPFYWRFYVRAAGHERFAAVVGSWHPIKAEALQSRFGPAIPAKPR
ncbi:MAG TPA: LAGLIDADG family homing endonuclease [Actinomycetota bacterium]|nr:LAGLIDADG family homing endonuclease [Actinomycetota bacterium]